MHRGGRGGEQRTRHQQRATTQHRRRGCERRREKSGELQTETSEATEKVSHSAQHTALATKLRPPPFAVRMRSSAAAVAAPRRRFGSATGREAGCIHSRPLLSPRLLFRCAEWTRPPRSFRPPPWRGDEREGGGGGASGGEGSAQHQSQRQRRQRVENSSQRDARHDSENSKCAISQQGRMVTGERWH